TGVSSTPSACAPDWIAANWPTPATDVELRKTAARVMLGATCLSNSTHLPPKLNSKLVKPVALPSREALHPAGTNRVRNIHHHEGMVVVRLQHGRGCQSASRYYHVGRKRHQFGRLPADGLGAAACQTIINQQVCAHRPTKLPQGLLKAWLARLY